MSLYHFSVNQISRGCGQTAVSAAAYRSGEKLHDYYYGEEPDYTKKGGVLYTDILLPAHAPERLSDRQTLWNELENIEKHPKAQLAYSFNIALQNELTYEENLELAKQFVLENFVSKGMIVDLALHQPDKTDSGIPNPHFHVLSPIRPLNPDGTWGSKQYREYILDEEGNRVTDSKGKFKFNAIPTTDWGNPETLVLWRQSWADLCNSKFKEKGLDCRIDSRSLQAQGIDLIPSIHEGPAVRAMGKKGIKTNKGSWNRLIKSANSLFKRLNAEIQGLVSWIAELSAAIANEHATAKQEKMESNTFIDIITSYYSKRNEGAYSAKAKSNNLKRQAELINFIRENNIYSFEDLENSVSDMYSKSRDASKEVRKVESEIKEIDESLRIYDMYTENKPYHDELCKIKRKSKSDDYKKSHQSQLKLFYYARRKIKEQFPDDVFPLSKLKARRETLDIERYSLLDTYHELSDAANKTYSIKRAIEDDYKKAISELTPAKSKTRKEPER